MTLISQNIQINLPLLQEKEVQLFIKREDLLHPTISGNKYRKLKYNLQEALLKGRRCLLTFGGGYSNHILAIAAAGKENGFQTVGIIRGEELGKNLTQTLATNPTLKKAHQLGMQLEFVSRQAYQEKENSIDIQQIIQKYPYAYLIPEGGSNDLAVKGCEEILTESDVKFSHICCAMGTGGTVTGIINSSASNQKVLVFPALKGDWITDAIQEFHPNKENWKVVSDYHFGGYAKITMELVEFINQFKEQTGIPLDPVYTGKMLFGIVDLIQKKQFEKGSCILAIHTGGLQGISGMNLVLKRKNLPLLK